MEIYRSLQICFQAKQNLADELNRVKASSAVTEKYVNCPLSHNNCVVAILFFIFFVLKNCRKLGEHEAQLNAMREELRKLRAENEQLKVQGFQKDGECDVRCYLINSLS